LSLAVDALVFGIISAALVSVAAVGFTMQYGVTNVLNLAYGTIITSAIFVSYLASHLVHSLALLLLVAALWGAIFSWMISVLLIDRFVSRGANLVTVAIATISIGLIVQFGLAAVQGQGVFTYPSFTGAPVRIFSTIVSTTQLVTVGIAVAVMVFVHVLLRSTRIGLAMRLMAADSALARTCGIPTGRVRGISWALSGVMCGLAAGLLAVAVGTFDSTTGNDLFILVVAAAIVGGIGEPYGAMIGALIIGIVSESTAAYLSPSLKDVVACAVIVVVLLVRPRGLFAEFSSGRELVK
jgi:branched-subunit amino acid ABC-type transport system permease component